MTEEQGTTVIELLTALGTKLDLLQTAATDLHTAVNWCYLMLGVVAFACIVKALRRW